jgi:putative DNA primase/helicase
MPFELRPTLNKKHLSAWPAVSQGYPVIPEHLDQDPWLFNVENGTIDLKTGELRPHERGALITKLAPVQYDREAECPTWWKFLMRIFNGNLALIEFLQKAVGYALTGSTREQCLFFLHGLGANGKSTLLEIIHTLLGDYAHRTSSETFLIKKSGGIPNDVAALRGARLVGAVEVESGRRLAEVLIKEMTGGDRISARFLHAEWFDFKPEFKIFLAANHKPVIRGTDHAIWRRIHLIPFNVQIPKPEQDRDLPEKLKAELPGILNWALEGCQMWQLYGLEPPAEVQAATQDYREEMDPGRLPGRVLHCGPESRDDGG